MKRCGMWFFIGFVLAILLTLCAPPERRTGVFLDSPMGRAHAVDRSRLLVPAVELAEPSLHLEARAIRAGPDECLALFYNFSLEHAPLRANETPPPRIDPRGPPVLVPTAQRARLQGPPVPRRGVNYPPNPRNWGSCKDRGFATCNFYNRL
jgi:hypothetical protein